MWFLLCAVAVLSVSGTLSARHWLYGWHRELPRLRLEAMALHLTLTAFFSIHGLTAGLDTLLASVLLISPLSVLLGYLLIKRDPPRELSRAHIPTSAILER